MEKIIINEKCQIMIISPQWIVNIGHQLRNILKKLGYRYVRVVYEKKFNVKKNIDQNFLYILLACKLDIMPKKYIFYQLEQTSSKFFTDKYIERMNNSICIWDFSRANKYEGINKKRFYLPLPFDRILDYPLCEKFKYDLLFYGSKNERRIKITNYLKKKYKIKVGFNIFNEKLKFFMMRSKIVINLHFYIPAAIEQCRFNEVLQYNRLIISEKGYDDDENEKRYDGLVVFTDVIGDNLENIEKLDKLIKHYLKQKHYKKKIKQIIDKTKYLHSDSLKNIDSNLEQIGVYKA